MIHGMGAIALVVASIVATPAPEAAHSPAGPDLTFYQDVAWSQDGKSIASSVMRVPRARWDVEKYGALKDTRFDVFVIPVDGSRPVRVTDNPGNDLWPVWWPGGRCLLYSWEREGASGLSYINADGSGRDDAKGLPAHASQPAVSPDGKRVAFTLTVGDESHVYVKTVAARRALRRVSSTGPHNSNPVWSPDGKWILFYSDRRGQGRDQVFVAAADGSAERALTDDEFNNIFPAWSPDGKRIIFASNRDGQAEEGIFVMDADGSHVRRLVPDVRAFFARWSPDGQKLAFVGGRFPDTQIYIADADGSHAAQLTR